jgi:predicted esterase
MIRTTLNLLFSFFVLTAWVQVSAQSKPPELSPANEVENILNQLQSNKAIDADSTFKVLRHWNKFPEIEKTGCDYNYYYNDAVYGRVPLHVYIPASYKRSVKNSAVVMLHGAVGMSKFNDIDSLANSEEDVLFDALKAQNYIVIRPIADKSKQFDWVTSKYSHGNEYYINLTFKVLNDILTSLKKVLNIDDSRVYAFGHSDGSDGAVGLGIYKPNAFAGVVGYNSMLNNIFARDYYIRNIQNRPTYLVHSDLDDLRPILMTRAIVDSLKKTDKQLWYKEYTGYQHFDKHLDIDVPLACKFMNGISRNPFGDSIYWETYLNGPYSACDWLEISKVDTAAKPANWHQPLNVPSYDKGKKEWRDGPYYFDLNKSATVKANYKDNTFNLQTSGITEVALKISPTMVNLNKPVNVTANGKQIFKAMVKADKNYLLNNFAQTADRDAIWVNSIKLKVD